MKSMVAVLGLFAMTAVAVVAPTGAARSETSQSEHICTFLLLSPGACAQLLRTRQRAQGTSHVSAPAGATLVYASEPLASAVSIFSLGSKGFVPAGQLMLNDIPIGVTVDALQRLYVAVTSLGGYGPNSVEVFPRGATKPSKIYTDGLTGPDDVAVDSHGTLYVANLANFNCSDPSGDGSVVEYAKGSMKPTSTITDIPGCPHALGLDANDNLYVTYLYNVTTVPSSDVIEYARGSTKGRALNLKAPGLKGLGTFFWRVAVDGKGDLLVTADGYDGSLGQILVYPPRSRRASKAIEYGNWSAEYFASPR